MPGLCDPHARALKAEVERQGLGSLLAEDVAEAMRRGVEIFHEGANIDNFEPVVIAMSKMIGNTRAVVSEQALAWLVAEPNACMLCMLNLWHWQRRDENDCCPDCGEKAERDPFDRWIALSVAEVVDEWKSLSVT